MAESETIQRAYESLLDDCDADPGTLRHDLTALIEDLGTHGFMALNDASVAPMDSAIGAGTRDPASGGGVVARGCLGATRAECQAASGRAQPRVTRPQGHGA